MNPFCSREVRPDRNIYRFAIDHDDDQAQRDQFMGRLQRLLHTHRRAAIVGPHGTGKTTLLTSLMPMLCQRYQHVTKLQLHANDKSHNQRELAVHRQHRDSGASTCFLIDGYEQMTLGERLAWVRWVKRTPQGALLVTSHRRPVLIPMIQRTQWDSALAMWLTNQKIQQLSLRQRDYLRERFSQHAAVVSLAQQNLRNLWSQLYDDYEAFKVDQRQSLKGKPHERSAECNRRPVTTDDRFASRHHGPDRDSDHRTRGH